MSSLLTSTYVATVAGRFTKTSCVACRNLLRVGHRYPYEEQAEGDTPEQAEEPAPLAMAVLLNPGLEEPTAYASTHTTQRSESPIGCLEGATRG